MGILCYSSSLRGVHLNQALGPVFDFRLQLMTCFITLTCFLYFTSTFGSIVSGLNSNIATDIETNVQYPINQKNAYLNT